MPATAWGITWGTPYYEGSAVAAEVPDLFQVAIAGRAYIIEVAKYRRRSIDPLRDTSDQSEETGENSLNPRALWRRSASDWSLGSGKEFFDEDDERRQFFTSKGVDPWDRNKLSLLPDTTQIKSLGGSSQRILTVNGYLYVSNDGALHFSNTPDTGASYTAATGLPGQTVNGLTTDGKYVYALANGIIYRALIGNAAFALFGNARIYTMIGFANGRLLAAAGNILAEVKNAGTDVLLHTHEWDGFSWTLVASSPGAIYAVATSSDVSELYAITVNDATGALRVPVFVGSPQNGEIIRAVEHYQGVLALGTNMGFRLAALSGTEVRIGPLIEIAGGVNDLAFDNRYLWFTWGQYDASSTGLGRADLARSTDTLVPAYASDLMVSSAANVYAVARLGGKTYFTLVGAGLYGESANKVPSGTVTSGWIRMGVVDSKMFSFLGLACEPLQGTVAMAVIDNAGVQTSAGTYDDINGVGTSEPFTLNNLSAEAIKVVATLNRSSTDNTKGPELRRWLLQGIPTPSLVDEILVPIILKDEVMSRVGSVLPFDVLQEYAFLHGLLETRRVIRYQEGAISESVYVDGLEVEPEAWSPDEQFFQGIVTVRLKTVG